MDKTTLVELFERKDFNNAKELDYSLFPGALINIYQVSILTGY